MNGLRRDCVNKCKDSQGHSCINNDSERCLPFVPLTGCRHGSASLLCGESPVNNSRRDRLMTARKVYLVTGAGSAQVGDVPGFIRSCLAAGVGPECVGRGGGEASKLTPHLQPRRSVRMEPKLRK